MLLWLRVIPRSHLRHPLSPLRIFVPLLTSFSVSSLLSFSHSIHLFNKQYKSFAFSSNCSPFGLVELLASTPSHPIALNTLNIGRLGEEGYYGSRNGRVHGQSIFLDLGSKRYTARRNETAKRNGAKESHTTRSHTEAGENLFSSQQQQQSLAQRHLVH